MAGEPPVHDPVYLHQISGSDYDESDASLPPVEPSELLALIEAIHESGRGYPGMEGREDWALERECEIHRLERENDELRRSLGIDPDSIAASGIDMEAEIARMDAPRHPELSERRRNGHSQQGSGDRWEPRPSYWDGNGNGGGNGGQQHQAFQPPPPPPPPNTITGGAPLQRAMDLPGGMRMMQGRRSGIFGGGQQPRGLVIRGASSVSIPVPPPTSSLSLWSNQPASPAPPTMPERPWQSASGASLDANR